MLVAVCSAAAAVLVRHGFRGGRPGAKGIPGGGCGTRKPPRRSWRLPANTSYTGAFGDEGFGYDTMRRPVTIIASPASLGARSVAYTCLGEPLTEATPSRQFDCQYDHRGRLGGLWDKTPQGSRCRG